MPGGSEVSVAEQPVPAALVLLILGEELGPSVEALSEASRSEDCAWNPQDPSMLYAMPGV